jgi:uncharacterized membrane protein
MKPFLNFFLKHGLAIMIVGFLIFFSSFLVMLFSGKYDLMLRHGAFAGAITGFSIYLIGRVSVFVAKRTKKTTEEL